MHIAYENRVWNFVEGRGRGKERERDGAEKGEGEREREIDEKKREEACEEKGTGEDLAAKRPLI